MNNKLDCIDITSQLHLVNGGAGRAQKIWDGAKAAYKVGRPILKESADVAKDIGVLGGVGYGAKKAWDAMTGGGQPAPAEQPKQ